MKDFFTTQLVTKLRRRTATTCSIWAQRNRVMGQPFPGPYSFKYHPWTKDMHDCDRDWVSQKGAQLSVTETLLNRTFYTIDVLRSDVLYILPTKTPDATDFSAARFDPALELSDHLSNLFSDVKNVGHKRAGTVNLYIRGSRSRSQLKSVPAGTIIFDEFDEMNQSNVTLAEERSSGQRYKQKMKVSTPTVHGFGINLAYAESTQEEYHFPCPCCSRSIRFTFPDSLIITGASVIDPAINDSHYICTICKGKIDQASKHLFLAKGEWVAQYPGRDTRGFCISQLYSSTVSPVELAKAYLRGQTNQADEQEFYNSKLGLPFTAEDARITEAHIQEVIGQHKSRDEATGTKVVTMGVDVGKWLHVEIDEWVIADYKGDLHAAAKCRVIKQLKVHDFEQLDELMNRYRVNFCIIDANPERRKATEFARRHYARVRICFYGNNVNGKEIHIHKEDPAVTVDRTTWMDTSLGRFKGKSIILPFDVDYEYKEQIKAPVKKYEKDGNGNPVARYLEGSGSDHYAHARTYAEIALSQAANMMVNQSIESAL